jgi:peptide/nickel transport system substrate-binding protein
LSTLGEETFLPWWAAGLARSYMFMIYETLLYLDPVTGQLKPGLAIKWEMSKDAKTWTFWLRQGVQFHEGWGELIAEDVKYTFERQKEPDSKSPHASMLRKIVSKVEAPERYKVVFYLTGPDIEFVNTFICDTSTTPILCKKYIETVGNEKANSHPIGTGPYTLGEEHKKGTPIKLKTIEGIIKHWRVTPEFKALTFLNVPEEATRVAMLKAGEVDLAPISYDSINTIKASGLNIISLSRNWQPRILFGGSITTDPKRYDPKNPWADKPVRQALNYAIDKEAIAKNIFHDEASPAGSSTLIPQWFHIKPYPFDLSMAKKLLVEAGYPKTYTTVPGAELPIIGEAVGMYWKMLGLDVKIVPSDFMTVFGEWTGGKANNFVFTQRAQAFSGALEPITVDNTSASLYASYVTKDIEAWVDKIAHEFDENKRNQLLIEYGQYLHDEACNVFLVQANEPYGVSKKVGRWPTIRNRPSNFDLITHQ